MWICTDYQDVDWLYHQKPERFIDTRRDENDEEYIRYGDWGEPENSENKDDGIELKEGTVREITGVYFDYEEDSPIEITDPSVIADILKNHTAGLLQFVYEDGKEKAIQKITEGIHNYTNIAFLPSGTIALVTKEEENKTNETKENENMTMEETTEKKHYCSDCAHFNVDEMKCTDVKGLFHGIKLTEQVADAENGCPEFEEARYSLTPKGILFIALMENGIEVSQEKIDKIWESFSQSMITSGYVKENNETDTENNTAQDDND